MFRTLLVASMACAAAAACGDKTTCGECANAGCEWCPTTAKCYRDGWFNDNPCAYYETIDKKDAKYCECGGSDTCAPPPPSNDKTACLWYTQETGSDNPAEWAGGDFLPYNYRTAARCACSGCGDDELKECSALWEKNLPATSCVRASLLAGHKALSDDFKRKVKDTSYLGAVNIVEVFYDLHVKAYKDCCCAGEPAPYITWVGVFYGGAVLDCTAYAVGTLASIMQFGRCGCGW